jgi:hypothetical protein
MQSTKFGSNFAIKPAEIFSFIESVVESDETVRALLIDTSLVLNSRIKQVRGSKIDPRVLLKHVGVPDSELQACNFPSLYNFIPVNRRSKLVSPGRVLVTHEFHRRGFVLGSDIDLSYDFIYDVALVLRGHLHAQVIEIRSRQEFFEKLVI